MPTPAPVLYRYTSLPIAIDILTERHITLLSPDTWEDRNDAYYLERYAAERRYGCVLAMCFSTKSETFHHWKIFSDGSAGVCVEFNKAKLLKLMDTNEGILHRPVEYHWINDFKLRKPPLAKWPFLKRKAFQDEGEYRIIFECDGEPVRAKSFDIELACINKVTLSPWLPESVSKSVTKAIHRIDGCAGLKILRSSLISNSDWRKIIDRK